MDETENFIKEKISILKREIKDTKEFLKWNVANFDDREAKKELWNNIKLLFLYEYELQNWRKFINWIDGIL